MPPGSWSPAASTAFSRPAPMMAGPGGRSGHPDDRSLSDLLAELSNQVKVLISKEVELAKLEVKEQVAKGSKAGALLAGAGVAGLFGALLVSFALAWGLAAVIPAGFAFLIVGVVYLGVAGLLLSKGRQHLAEVSPAPAQTMATLKQDVQVAKAALSRGANSTSPPPRRRA